MERPIHVVGGGIAGLVAAITAAEGGAPVVLHEASDRPGGRAIGGTERPGVNLGPHAVFTDGALVRWLRARGLAVGLRRLPVRAATLTRVVDDRGTHLPLSQGVALVPTLRPREAPVEETFRSWAEGQFGERHAALLCRLAGLFTYHHDPGSLSARFVWDRYRRTFLSSDRIRWVAGGWASLVDALAQRAAELGVVLETGDRVTPSGLPAGPVVVATPLASAARLLGSRLTWPGARTALLDVIATEVTGWPFLVADVRSDLSTCCMIERETAIEPGLVGAGGNQLLQAHLGVGPGVGTGAGVARIEDALDRSVPGWREKVIWRRGHLVAESTGAVDPPGATWRDRPSIEQGEDSFLAGDSVAAPGMLSEVSVNSGVRAGRLAVEARRRRSYPVGWPTAELTPQRRMVVLAAAYPGASLTQLPTVGGSDYTLEPADETGAGYRLVVRGGGLYGIAHAAPGGTSATVALLSGRWPGRLLRRSRRRRLARAALRALLDLPRRR